MAERVDPSAVSVIPREIDDPAVRTEFVDFMCSQTFPFHVRTTWAAEAVEQWLQSGALDGGLLLQVQVGALPAGYVRLEDVHDEAVSLDLRIADAWRSRGIGSRALALTADHVFTNLPAFRIEGVTRFDNSAMRAAFRSCGFVLESYYRDAWPTGQASVASLGYARLKSDWREGAVTPVPWSQVLAEESRRMYA